MNKRLFILLVLIALFYTLSSPLAPYPFSPFIKVFPILLLLLWALKQLSGSVRLLTLTALIFSGCGDVLLAIPFEQSFIAGLSAFLVAHLFYIVIFARYVNEQQLSNARYHHLAALSMLVYSWIVAQLVMPEETVLKFAVIAYIGVISFMCIAAIFSARNAPWWHLAGALIFALSDTLIAWNAFRESIPLASIWIMASYYLAQYLIIKGIIQLTANAHRET
ncbi:lysoplasmalogenase [Planctobacterium marinum]|uniref:Lysoplasmalogenase n=1 Tax=Planctobacterium marinum TaxID=1631968 RepID=A0AA48KRS5_9ALTE|nr:hypothetical protein MACH26_19430 [Planctobacterium marinum]